ncbi:MAG: carboxylating nicotinate-nucleotide diphosphorylase [Gammaproteobacteria bacterium]|nr:carboxylating nicotinate-nucleotide diphosphorylase [Gammaproteobacteria bacterium]
MTMPDLPPDIAESVRRVLEEDIGSGDLTAGLVPDRNIRAELLVREEAVLCGTAWFDEVFRQLDERVQVKWKARDGERVASNAILCTVSGPARAILTGERCALNFLQTLSGTATLTSRYVDAIRGLNTKVLDTRKTIPGLRLAQKYAVACGGGHNHRMGLYDAVLIKENHIAAAGSVAAALAQAKILAGHGKFVEIEVETLSQLHDALDAGAQRILLDNFRLEALREAVAMTGGRAELEASGGVTLENLPVIAGSGVDFVSIGAITKHLSAVDLSLRILAS